ncbi:MAG: hypothetical protein ACI4TM_07305 [Candidatus Cryptobacteroides sp.]
MERKMRINAPFAECSGEEVWQKVVTYVKENNEFRSVTGIVYSATFVGSCIFIKGGTPGTKRADEGEYLTGKDFIYAWEQLKKLDVINTAKVRPFIKRQQTPFIGLLVCSGVLSI